MNQARANKVIAALKKAMPRTFQLVVYDQDHLQVCAELHKHQKLSRYTAAKIKRCTKGLNIGFMQVKAIDHPGINVVLY